ncbi:Cytochrome P450 2D15 [Gracilaria domingensis]|nr:Cytochrome P450 2D15 [Gracilaria domingensis]
MEQNTNRARGNPRSRLNERPAINDNDETTSAGQAHRSKAGRRARSQRNSLEVRGSEQETSGTLGPGWNDPPSVSEWPDWIRNTAGPRPLQRHRPHRACKRGIESLTGPEEKEATGKEERGITRREAGTQSGEGNQPGGMEGAGGENPGVRGRGQGAARGEVPGGQGRGERAGGAQGQSTPPNRRAEATRRGGKGAAAKGKGASAQGEEGKRGQRRRGGGRLDGARATTGSP